MSSTFSFPHVYENLDEIVDPFKGVLLDAYGVFWAGNQVGLFPNCKDLMHELVAKGKIIGILSNTTQLSQTEIVKFHKHGLIQNQHFHFVATSGDLARKMLLEHRFPFPTPRKTYYLFGSVHPTFSSHQSLFINTSYQEVSCLDKADFIYVSIPHINGEDQTDPSVFESTLKNLDSVKLPMVCTNPDLFAHEGNPPKAVVRQGSIAQMYKKMGGEVFYIGKPSQGMFSNAMEHFRTFGIHHTNDVLMVGDTLETDILGANQSKIKSALILKTGIVADQIEKNTFSYFLQNAFGLSKPDYLINRMAKNESF